MENVVGTGDLQTAREKAESSRKELLEAYHNYLYTLGVAVNYSFALAQEFHTKLSMEKLNGIISKGGLKLRTELLSAGNIYTIYRKKTFKSTEVVKFYSLKTSVDGEIVHSIDVYDRLGVRIVDEYLAATGSKPVKTVINGDKLDLPKFVGYVIKKRA